MAIWPTMNALLRRRRTDASVLGESTRSPRGRLRCRRETRGPRRRQIPQARMKGLASLRPNRTFDGHRKPGAAARRAGLSASSSGGRRRHHRGRRARSFPLRVPVLCLEPRGRDPRRRRKGCRWWSPRRPTTDGSEANRFAKSSALITATGVLPVASSSSRKTWPCLGMMPGTAK